MVNPDCKNCAAAEDALARQQKKCQENVREHRENKNITSITHILRYGW
jgi:glutaredoxin